MMRTLRAYTRYETRQFWLTLFKFVIPAKHNHCKLFTLNNSFEFFFFCIKSNNYRKKYNEIIIEIRNI